MVRNGGDPSLFYCVNVMVMMGIERVKVGRHNGAFSFFGSPRVTFSARVIL